MAKGKKSEDQTPTKRKTVYELVGERRLPFKRGVDPLDDILFDEERELSRELKRMRLEQIVMKRRQEIKRMKEQGGEMDMGSLPSNADFLNMAKLMADLSPEEAQRVRSSYTFLKMAEKGGGGGMAYMPMLLNYAKQNPGASENQMINYLKLMDSQLLKGLEIAKAINPPKQQGDPMTYMVKGMELMKTANPPKQQDNPMEFLKLMKDLVVEGVRNPLLQAMKELQPQPGLLEQIFMKPELFTRFKEIGMFGGSRGDATTSEFDLKIEQLRSTNQLEIKKLELQTQKMNLERETQDRRTDTLLSALVPFGALLAGPLNQRMMQLGQQQASAHNPTSGVPPMGNTVQIRCHCGYQGNKTFPGAMPPSFNCPQCGGELAIGDFGGGEPQETDRGT